MRRADIFIAIEWAELWPWGIGPKIGLRQDRPQQMCLLEICPRKWKAERKHWQWASMPIAKRTLASTISLLLGTLDDYCWRVEAQPSISPSSSECIFASSPTFGNKRGGERRRREKRGNKSRSTTTASRVPNRQQDSSGEKNEPCRPSGRRAYTNTNNGDGHNNNKWRAAQEMIIRPENCHASSTNNTVSSLPRAFYDRISILIQLFRTCSIGFLSLSFLNYYFARLFCVCGFFYGSKLHLFFVCVGGKGRVTWWPTFSFCTASSTIFFLVRYFQQPGATELSGWSSSISEDPW